MSAAPATSYSGSKGAATAATNFDPPSLRLAVEALSGGVINSEVIQQVMSTMEGEDSGEEDAGLD